MSQKASWARRRLLSNFETLERLKGRTRFRMTMAGYSLLAAIVLAIPFSFDSSKSQNYQILSILISLFIVAVIVRSFGKVHLHIKRHLPDYATVGESFECLITIKNEGKKTEYSLSYSEQPHLNFPSHETFLNSREPGEEERNVFDRKVGYYRWQWLFKRLNLFKAQMTDIPPIFPNKEVSFKIELTPMKRGHAILDRCIILKPDPMNLTRSAKAYHEKESIMILPKSYHVPTMFLPGDKNMNLHAESTTHRIGQSEDFTSLRDYRPGDPIKHIHWKSTARTGQLTVKQYDERSQLRYGLVLDTDLAPEGELVFEEAISLAASFIKSIPTGETLLDLFLYANEMVCLSTGKGAGDPRRALEALAGLQPQTESSIEDLHQQVKKITHRLNGIILIFQSWSEEHEALLASIDASQTPYYVYLIASSLDVNFEIDLPSNPKINHLIPGKIEEGLSQVCI